MSGPAFEVENGPSRQSPNRDENPNHIGFKSWRRLSPGQKRQIIRNRGQARKLVTQFVAQRKR